MEIVTVDTNYVNYLFEVEKHVSWNKKRRPYVGVVLEVDKNKYFAPMTSSRKNKKLVDSPMSKNWTFLPINNCEHGGINFNNMIPVVETVYKKVDTESNVNDLPGVAKYKNLLRIQNSFIIRNQGKIMRMAKFLYKQKVDGKLGEKLDNITCDFRVLEEGARQYEFAMKSGQPIISLLNKYDLTPEQYNKFRDKKPEANRNEIEKMIRADLFFHLVANIIQK